MASWSVEFTRDAERDIAKLDRSVRRRVVEKLEWLSNHFEDTFPLNLRGEFRDFYKLRVGDWRGFYRADWKKRVLIVVYIDRRDKAYKTR